MPVESRPGAHGGADPVVPQSTPVRATGRLTFLEIEANAASLWEGSNTVAFQPCRQRSPCEVNRAADRASPDAHDDCFDAPEEVAWTGFAIAR
jgi:hypothetical protein